MSLYLIYPRLFWLKLNFIFLKPISVFYYLLSTTINLSNITMDSNLRDSNIFLKLHTLVTQGESVPSSFVFQEQRAPMS